MYRFLTTDLIVFQLFEDNDNVSETEQTKTVKYVCLVELFVRDLNTDGVGVWEETFLKTGDRNIMETC